MQKREKNKAKACHSLGFQKNMKNTKLNFYNHTTPTQIGQSLLPNTRGVYLENENGESKCFSCEKFFRHLPFGVFNPGKFGAAFAAICGECHKSLLILPPGLVDKFFQRVERKLKKSLGGQNHG